MSTQAAVSTSWTALQLLSYPVAPSAPGLRQGAYNPRPPGVIQPGSTTDLTLRWLQSRPDARWWTAAQIVSGVGRHHKTVVWSLVYLRELNLIESTRWGATNPRYLRYRAKG